MWKIELEKLFQFTWHWQGVADVGDGFVLRPEGLKWKDIERMKWREQKRASMRLNRRMGGEISFSENNLNSV